MGNDDLKTPPAAAGADTLADDVARYDLLIVCQNRSYSLVQQGTRALMNWLATSQVFRPDDESVAKEWVEVYGGPGPTAHEAFIRGGYSGDYQPFLQCTVRTGKKAVAMPFGGEPDEGVFVFIDLRGVLWNTLAPRFKNRLAKVLGARIDIYTRDHVGLRVKAEVPRDEQPDETRFARRDRATTRVGTAVEEM